MPYDIAQICLTGHVVNSASRRHPASNEEFCSRCGAKTITACPDCGGAIRGLLWGERSSYFEGCTAYCSKCGKSYPWTEAALTAASQLANEVDLSHEDAAALQATLPDLVSDTASTTVAASRFRRIIAKAAPGVADAFKTILTNVATEAAKKIMFPGF